MPCSVLPARWHNSSSSARSFGSGWNQPSGVTTSNPAPRIRRSRVGHQRAVDHRVGIEGEEGVGVTGGGAADAAGCPLDHFDGHGRVFSRAVESVLAQRPGRCCTRARGWKRSRRCSDPPIASRSAAVQRAIRLLRAPGLTDSYSAAFTEWSDDPGNTAWAAAAADA